MSESPGVPVLFGGHKLPPLVEIGLTDLPKSGGAMAPPAPPGTTGLVITWRWWCVKWNFVCSTFYSISGLYSVLESLQGIRLVTRPIDKNFLCEFAAGLQRFDSRSI